MVYVSEQFMPLNKRKYGNIYKEVIKMKEVIEKLKKKVSDLVADAKTAEDVLRLANTLATLSNIKTQ